MEVNMSEVGKRSRKLLQKIKDEPLSLIIKPLKDKLDNKDSLEDLPAYRLVEALYFCKDSKIPDYLRKECLTIHLMLPKWD